MITQRTARYVLLLPVILVMGLFGAASVLADTTAQATITVNPSTRFQTITGWEVTTQSGELLETNTVTHRSNANPGFAVYAGQMFDLAVNDLGINRVRLEIGRGAESTTDTFTQYLNGDIVFGDHLAELNPVNDDSNPLSVDTFIAQNPGSATIPGFYFSDIDYRMDKIVLPIRQRLLAKGEALFLNVCYVAFAQNAFMQYTNPDEYAEFVLATYQHLKVKYGIVPDAWEVILEPDNTQFNGTRIGQAVAAASARLRQFGFTPHFILPSVTDMNNVFPYYNAAKTVLGSSGVSQDIVELAYHRYGVNDTLLPTIAAEASSRGINTAMLEHIGSDYQDLHRDLTEGNNSAWQRFVLGDYWLCPACSAAKYYDIDQTNPSNPKITMTPGTQFLRQYFHYVRRGAVRIQATTTNSAYAPAAFINTTGAYVVVVKTTASGSIAIQNLPAGTYGIRYTVAGPATVDLPDVNISAGQTLTPGIPGTGVITIYGKSGSSAATLTPTHVATATATRTATFTPTHVATATATRTATFTPTHVATATATRTATFTPTHIATATATRTATFMPTHVATATPINTKAPTATPVPSLCDQPPTQLQLLSPQENAVVESVRVRLTWSESACKDTFRLIVRKKSATGKIVLRKAKLTATGFTATLQNSQNYVWSIKACNPYGCQTSGWSPFRVQVPSK